MTDPQQKERRGFASLTVAQRRKVASQGGRRAHELGVAHKWTSAEASEAGRKGGKLRQHNDRIRKAKLATGQA